jgi:hypothetical protein
LRCSKGQAVQALEAVAQDPTVNYAPAVNAGCSFQCLIEGIIGREGFVILVQVGDGRELVVKRLPDPIPWPGCGPFKPAPANGWERETESGNNCCGCKMVLAPPTYSCTAWQMINFEQYAGSAGAD